MLELNQQIAGCILGTAVGDAIGLPREGLSRKRARRLFGDKPLHHALIGSRGMCSDDTEQTIMLAQALIEDGWWPVSLNKAFARRLRWWVLRLPAGVGFGTLRACIKLWLGFKPENSGTSSAGNGSAMRSALLGFVAQERKHLKFYASKLSRVTHKDTKAIEGSHVIAMAVRLIAREPENAQDNRQIVQTLSEIVSDPDLCQSIQAIDNALDRSLTAEQFADELGLANGVSGFVNHTVPVAIYCWLRYRGSFRDAVENAICLGGDTDTVGAIVGALAGAELGPDEIPKEWLDGLIEWPASVNFMRRLSDELANFAQTNTRGTPPTIPWPLVLLRNVFFLAVVLIHGFRRLLPPY